MHFHQVPLRIWVANQTGRTIFRENTYIDLPDGQLPPHNIEHKPPEAGHERQMRHGDTIVIVYEMMYLSEELVKRGYSGRAKVKFVFADGEKDHKKWIKIEPNVEYWSRPAIVEQARRSRDYT